MTWTCPRCNTPLAGVKSIAGHTQHCDVTHPEIFWSRIDKNGTGGCWLWQGAKRWDGYGRVNPHAGRQLTAHRYAWELTNGAIKEGFGVLHKCDTPACVNPDHLFVGSHAENMKDAHAKRRHAHGDRATRRKLSEADVLEIKRNPPKFGKHGNVKEYAARYGVRSGAIRAIVHGRYWKYVGLDGRGATERKGG